jgi:hypothetical protein
MSVALLADDRDQVIFHFHNGDVDRNREAEVLDQIARALVNIRPAVIPHGAPPLPNLISFVFIGFKFPFFDGHWMSRS